MSKRCFHQHFNCDNQKCISMNLTCDHHDNCGDKSDEEYCQPNLSQTENENKVLIIKPTTTTTKTTKTTTTLKPIDQWPFDDQMTASRSSVPLFPLIYILIVFIIILFILLIQLMIWFLITNKETPILVLNVD